MRIGANRLCRADLSNHRMWYLPKRACSTAFPPLREHVPIESRDKAAFIHSRVTLPKSPNDPGAARTLKLS